MTHETTLAIRICAWCGAQLGAVRWPWTGEAEVRTHGICSSCAAHLKARRTAPNALRASC